jgi:hypothetical protein
MTDTSCKLLNSRRLVAGHRPVTGRSMMLYPLGRSITEVLQSLRDAPQNLSFERLVTSLCGSLVVEVKVGRVRNPGAPNPHSYPQPQSSHGYGFWCSVTIPSPGDQLKQREKTFCGNAYHACYSASARRSSRRDAVLVRTRHLSQGPSFPQLLLSSSPLALGSSGKTSQDNRA